MQNKPAERYWPLPLTIALMPDETATGFVSRLAARNGFPNMYAFYRTFGIDGRRVRAGDPDALAVIGRLSGADASVLSRRLFANEKHAFSYAGQALPPGWCNVTISKFCPSCIEADIFSQPHLSPSASPYQRWFWRLIPLVECPEHGNQLVTLTETNQKLLTDFTCCINRTLIRREMEALSGISPQDL